MESFCEISTLQPLRNQYFNKMAACCVPGTVETSGNTSAMKVNVIPGHMERVIRGQPLNNAQIKKKLQDGLELFRSKEWFMLEAVVRGMEGWQMKLKMESEQHCCQRGQHSQNL